MMSQADQKTLTKSRSELVRNLIVDEALLSNLVSRGVLTEIMNNNIEAIHEKKMSARASELLSIVPRRGQYAFRNFVEALLETNQEHLAEMLSPVIVREWFQGKEKAASPAVEKAISTPVPTRPLLEKEEPKPVEVCNKDVAKEEVPRRISVADIYAMKSTPRGRAIIFNNRQFSGPVGGKLEAQMSLASEQCVAEPLPNRDGSEHDHQAMINVFQRLEFTTIFYENCTAHKIRELIAEEQKMALPSCDAFICLVMSHGRENIIFGVDGAPVNIDKDILEPFDAKHCPALAGKPKLFFIQACQGDNTSKGVDVGQSLPVGLLRSASDADSDQSDAVPSAKLVHEKIDFFVAYATVQGYRSFRRNTMGSWFVNAIAKVFNEHAYAADLLELMTKVSNEVSVMRTRAKDPANSDCLQAPEFKSSLTKKFYFFPHSVCNITSNAGGDSPMSGKQPAGSKSTVVCDAAGRGDSEKSQWEENEKAAACSRRQSDAASERVVGTSAQVTTAQEEIFSKDRQLETAGCSIKNDQRVAYRSEVGNQLAGSETTQQQQDGSRKSQEQSLDNDGEEMDLKRASQFGQSSSVMWRQMEPQSAPQYDAHIEKQLLQSCRTLP